MKPITTDWRDATKLTSECKLLTIEVQPQNTMFIVLQDPAEQKFVLRVIALVTPGLSGNIQVVNSSFQIEAMEMDPGERIGKITF